MRADTLALFDIDATMLVTNRAGVRAMIETGQEMVGPGFHAEGVSFAGNIDPLLVEELLIRNGAEAHDGAIDEFRARYAKRLENLLPETGARALPGVAPLLDALEREEGVVLGVLTGNYPETGAMKLRAAGIDPSRFKVCVWGCDSPHRPARRTHLPAVALERCARDVRAIGAERVVIIGDTPHDVACAKEIGGRALGVATGSFSTAQLSEAGADLAVETLSETIVLASWMVG
ncbi:MAG: HAD family hydrolase [Phycisphaerales bacterium]